MSDLDRYIQKREKKNPNFRVGLEEERRNLRIGLLIKELRIERGMTQEQLARETQTTKSAISRLENHAESITLATLEKVAHALGKVVHIKLS
jgi:DNA-binding Xre family transcriptional regulator